MLGRVATEIRAGRNPAREAGVVGMLATPEQRLALSKHPGMMSLLEGHGDVTMDRAGAAEVPGAARFSRVLHERRTQARGLAKLMSASSSGSTPRCASTPRASSSSSRWRTRAARRCWPGCWEGPEWLPTLEEIRDPGLWVARAGG